MSGDVPIEIEDKPTAVTIMRELVEHLQDAIEALKREIVRNPKSDEYRKRTLHHRQTNLGAGGGKSIALTIKGSNAIALPTHGSGRFESRATVYDPQRSWRQHHSITSAAPARSGGGTVRPSTLAVFRLITSSNAVGCCTGRLAGLAPPRILPA